ncbi:MAG TPA: GGDEF domain-containing protein [Usitatibacter sp.]|nr:GGDEF domain-containing protein [Usitatibacter sp.]
MKLPSAERLAGAGLGIAAITILALALLARFELDREAELHREVIGALAVKDSLEALRTELNDLRGAALLARLAPSGEALQTVERRAVEIDAELGYLAGHPQRVEAGDAFGALAQAARLLAVNARSVAQAGSREAQDRAAELERLGGQAGLALDRTLEAQRRRINDGTLARIRVSETLRAYVSWLLAGSIAVLVGLFGFYRWAKSREAAALQRIEYIAHHDTVTGLPNRALLTDRLEHEVARAIRHGRGFAVLMFDLDGFKPVNDTWGHAAGDQVLARVAQRARACMRASDTVGRLGGDEFMAILPEVGEEGAMQVAEKLRAALEEPYVADGFTASVSASFGIALHPHHGKDADALQKAADGALYAAKGAGKNRIETAQPPPAAPAKRTEEAVPP